MKNKKQKKQKKKQKKNTAPKAFSWSFGSIR